MRVLMVDDHMGTCFSVRLQTISSARPSEAASRETASDRDDAVLLRRHRVLAVDDEPDALKSLHFLLHEIGVKVQSASDLDGAKRLVDDGFRPTLLILDFRLGEKNGLEVLTYLRSRLGELPALLLSGDTVNAQLRDCVDAITLVEHKPLSGHRLLSAISQVAISGARELPT
jgi:two-component system, sensor histidine kinase